jgi:predicted esterase
VGGSAAGASGGTAGAGGSGGSTGPLGRCGDTPPPGAPEPAAPKPYSGGSCPTLAPGLNTIQSTVERQFILVVPTDLRADERVPLVFLWHWMGGTATGFLERGEVQLAVDAQRFVAVIPESIGHDILGLLDVKWPFDVSASQQRMDEELRFFDDMLACVSEQYSVNEHCVSTAGVSAGALWSAQLASFRGEYLASFISLSGGTGGSLIRPWGNPAHKMPAIALWGGPTDNCFGVMNFEETTRDLEQNLTSGGHFFVECLHNCGHGEPPIESGTTSKYQMLFDFVFDHPFWLGAGESPYLQQSLPASFPSWCGIGAGSAVPRTGDCPAPGC